MAKEIRLSRELVEELCPECAQEMRARGILALKLNVVDPASGEDPTLKLLGADDRPRVYAGFSQGLCKRFGADEGFFTRCAETMVGKDGIDDEKSFCASLHKYCTGSWPGEKKKDHAAHQGMTRDEMRAAIKVKHPDMTDAAIAKMDDDEMAALCAKMKGMVDAERVAEYSNIIRGIEIFCTGTHNGDEYTVNDLDQIVTAAKQLDFSPAIKVGHTKDQPGSPAYGWVKNLRRAGEKLYADFEDMHDSVVDALRKRAYDRVSSEIYFNLKRDGKLFPRALKAVALLGAEVPAVANLIPLHKMQFAESGFEAVAACEQQLEVPTEALINTFAERVAGLVNLMKESDMAKNADKIKTLETQVADFKAKMDEMMKKKGQAKPEELEDDAEYKQLAEQAQAISDQIAELEADDKAADTQVAELREELEAANERATAAEAQAKTFNERLARIETEKRNAEIGERVRACKIPAFRPGLSALYAYALEHAAAQVKVYTEKDGKPVAEDKTLAEVVDGFVTGINTTNEKLFKAMAFAGQTERPDGTTEESPAREVDNRVRKYRIDHPEVKSYETALSAVLAADTELATRYRESFGGTAQ